MIDFYVKEIVMSIFKKLLFFVLLICILCCLITIFSCNSVKKNGEESLSETDGSITEQSTDEPQKIALNGGVEEKLQVNTQYVEKGVIIPDGFVLNIEGDVFENIIGKYHIKYSIYSKEGELVKELNRFVEVVDELPPVYEPKKIAKLYAGVVYQSSDFFSNYYDDYYGRSVSLTPSSVCFKAPGNQEVEIELSDPLGNTITFKKAYTVILDIQHLLNEKYKNQPSKISTSTEQGGHIFVSIDSQATLGYFISDKSLHYVEKVQTQLGTYASIQISAPYGSFDKANISFHIDGNDYSHYSVGFASFDATQDYDTLIIRKFSSTINYLNLNTSQMLAELNQNLLQVLNKFKFYVNNDLNIEFK